MSAYTPDDLIRTDIAAYLAQHENKSLLRFITCGSVDDGKSTLIGRLLYDAKMIFEDQLAALEARSQGEPRLERAKYLAGASVEERQARIARQLARIAPRSISSSAGWPDASVTVNGVSANQGSAWDVAEGRASIGYDPRDDVRVLAAPRHVVLRGRIVE